MYVPDHFREDRIDVLHAAMTEIGAATLISNGPGGLIASHLPIEVSPDPAPLGTLRCHFARANSHAEVAALGGELLVVFQGPQGYVSPSWYPSKKETGKVVPTWNYVAIHAHGTGTTFERPELLRRHLAAMTDRHEAGGPDPWSIDDAPAAYIDQMCRAIIGLEIRLTRIEGKWKMSQNRSRPDRRGAIDGLRARGDEANRKLADLVEAANADAEE